MSRRLEELHRCNAEQAVELGCDLANAGRLSEAQRCFSYAERLGCADGTLLLGDTYADQSKWQAAVDAYRRAADTGDPEALMRLGSALWEVGDEEAAREVYRDAARKGDDPEALVELAFLERQRGQHDAALALVLEAVEADNDLARGVLACWQWLATRDVRLESDLRAGADVYSSARAALAELFLATGRVHEARTTLETGAKLGEDVCFLPLGNFYRDELRDFAAARRAYLSGIEAGDAHCHYNLARLLEFLGDTPAAEEHYRLGAAAGDALAAEACRAGKKRGGR
jgi:tetratricopeptide (TPR) repeat protein